MPRLLRRRLDTGRSAQHDQVGQRDLLAAGRRAVELLAHRFQLGQHLLELAGLVHRPFLLRREPDPRAIGAAALVAATEGRGRGPGRRHQLRDAQAAGQQLGLERGDVLVVHQRMADRGHRVLPDQLLLRHQLAEVAGHRPHVAVRQLEPGAREGVGQLGRVLHEAARDLLVGRVDAQRQVGRRHHRRVALGFVMRVGHGAGAGAALGRPLVGAGWALRQLPFVAEQGLEVAVVPGRRRRRPGALDAAGDRVDAHALAQLVLPAQALLLEPGALRHRADVMRLARAVRLAEGMAAGDQRHRFLVVHRHAAEGLADVARGGRRIGLAVRPFRIHVDQAHLHRRQRIGQVAVAGITLVAEPGGLRAPEGVGLRLPDVGAAARETEGLEAHRLQRDVARQDHQVGPRQLAAVLLLDRPEQAPGLVEVAVVGPAVQRREALRAGARAAAAVLHAVGAGRVPGHADEEGAVVAVVGGPPVLRVGHQRMQVLDHRVEVQGLEFPRVLEFLAHRIGLGRMQGKDGEVELLGPPVAVAFGPGHRMVVDAAREWALGIA